MVWRAQRSKANWTGERELVKIRARAAATSSALTFFVDSFVERRFRREDIETYSFGSVILERMESPGRSNGWGAHVIGSWR